LYALLTACQLLPKLTANILNCLSLMGKQVVIIEQLQSIFLFCFLQTFIFQDTSYQDGDAA